jgi:hypothetical protein
MEFPPIDFSPEHKLWTDHCLARLELALENPQEKAANLRWQEPDEWLPTLLLAERLVEFERNHRAELLALATQVPASATQAPASASPGQAILQESLSTLGRWLYQLVRTSTATFDDDTARFIQLLAAQKASECYVVFRKYNTEKCLGLFLQSMFLSGHSITVRLAVDLLVEQPPEHWTDVAQALSVLMQSTNWKVIDVFPKILETTRPSVLAPAFDLANMLVRKQGLTPHPAAEKIDTFLSLFGNVTQQLLSLEENPRKFSDSVQVVHRCVCSHRRPESHRQTQSSYRTQAPSHQTRGRIRACETR